MRRAHRTHVLNFSGGFVDLGTHARFDVTRAFSMAAWIRPAAFGGSPYMILSKDYLAYELMLREDKLRFSAQYEYSTDTKILAERWMHVAVSFDADKEDDNFTLFVNGDPAGKGSNRHAFKVNDTPLQIGTRALVNWGNFIGDMAGLAMWQRPSTPWEVKTRHNGLIDLKDPDLIGYWPMDTDSGDKLLDLGPGQHHGTLSGRVAWSPHAEPVRHSKPARALRRNTSITRHDEIERGAAPDQAGTHVEALAMPPSGTNGAAHALLTRAKAITQKRTQEQLKANAELRAKALSDAQRKRDAAHAKAVSLMNSQRFDKLFFIANGVIHQALSDHSWTPFLVDGKTVQARDLAVDLTRDMVFWVEPQYPFQLRGARFTGQDLGVSDHAITDAPVTAVAIGIAPNTAPSVFRIVGTGRIYRSPLDGGTSHMIRTINAPGGDANWQLAVDETNWALYWTSGSGIWTTKLSGTASTDDLNQFEHGTVHMAVAPTDAPEPVDLAVDGASGKIYWSDRALGMVRRANLDGSDAEDLYAVDHPLRGMTLDAVSDEMKKDLTQDIYWTAWEDEISPQTKGARASFALDAGQGTALDNRADPFAPASLSNVVVQSNPDRIRLKVASDFHTLPQGLAARLSDPKGCTLGFWVRFATLDGPQTILSATGAWTHSHTVSLTLIRKTVRLDWNGVAIATPATIRAKTWHHIAVIYDPDAGSVHLHLDGAHAASAPASPVAESRVQHLFVNETGPRSHFLGELSDLSLHSGAQPDVVAAGQPVRVHAATPPLHLSTPQNLLAAPDPTPRWARHASPPLARPAASVLRFSGPSDYVRLGRSDKLHLSHSSFTVEAWVYPRLGDQFDGTILAGEGNQRRKGLHLLLRDKRPYLGFYADDLSGQTQVPDDAWTHLAFRFDASTKTQSVFVNGVLDGERICEGPLLGVDDIYLSRSHTSPFLGLMSRVRLWSVARSDDLIRTNMRAFRETYLMRAPVDGAGPVDKLFEVPAEGGLTLVSRTKAALERRLISARERKAAHQKAADDIAAAHAEATVQIDTKHHELAQAHTQATVDIAAKKASETQTRASNRARYAAAQSEKTRKLDGAKQQSAQRRTAATQSASAKKDAAHATAGSRKAAARRKLNTAHTAKRKYD